jgi:hypothetical protein
VAEDPRKIMAALLHDHLKPKALFKKSPQPPSTPHQQFSHNLAATIFKAKQTKPYQSKPTPGSNNF